MTIFPANISIPAKTETRTINGVPTLVTNFSVAENYLGPDGQKRVQYYRIALWRERGAKLAQYLYEGRSITLTGRVRAGKPYQKDGVWKCDLEMVNPQITFNTANKKKADEPVTDAEILGEETDVNEQPF